MALKEKLPVLFVDDEQNLLDGMKRQLRRFYKVYTAPGGHEGLEIMEKEGPFPVVVSDMKMPIMNGAEFLKKARALAPDTTRLLLTGQADFNETIEAVNEGNIYRFLHKPCALPLLIQNLEDGIRQYNLIQDQRILLEETLSGSIKTLTDVLALANPTAFGRAVRAKKLMAGMIAHLEMTECWHIEVATMLSQISYIALPPEVAEKVYKGSTLLPSDEKMIGKLPHITESLLGSIPRIEPVRDILKFQHTMFDGRDSPEKNVSEEEIPVGARMLKIVLDFDSLVSKTGREDLALDQLGKRKGWYDPSLLNSFREVCLELGDMMDIRSVKAHAVQIGMIFTEDLRGDSGQLLIARGQEINDSIQARVQHWSNMGMIDDELTMIVPKNMEVVEEQQALAAFMAA